MFRLKANNPVMKRCAQSENYFECCQNGMGLLLNYFYISCGKYFLFYLQGVQIEIIVKKKPSLRVSHELSIYLRYLQQ